MKRAGFVLLWVAASFATALVAWSAVRLAGDQVSERPVRPLSADEVAALAATTLPPAGPAETSSTTTTPAAAPSTTTSRPTAATSSTSTSTASTTTTRPGVTSTSRPPRSTTTTTTPPRAASTTSPSTTTTAPPSTTTSPPAPTVTAYQLEGGSVVISASPGQVSLVSASPRSGFTMEIKAAGPAEVRVEFEGETESRFRARWSGGSLDVDIDEE